MAMSEEHEAGAAYLSALKRPATQVAGAAALTPSSAPQGLPGVTEPSEKVLRPSDKRRTPRYQCQGSAHLREAASGSSTWATFTDISQHGCYVEAMSTFPVGTKLALTIEVNGFRVETAGEVRIVYPSLGMGISFAFSSEEHRERLRELLRSLSRRSTILTPPVSVRATAATNAPSSPEVLNSAAAMNAIMEFFDDRNILTREEFFRVLKRSQNSER